VAQRIEIKTITVPAGTALASPQVTALNFSQGHVIQLELRIPPGPSGLLGIQLAHSGQPIIPHDASEWLITDDEAVIWPLEGYPTPQAWTVRAYNTDVYNHTFQVRMLFNEIGPQLISSAAPPAILAANASAGQGGEGLPPLGGL